MPSAVATPAHPRHRNPADRVFRVRMRETIQFPDLTERRALKLSAVPHYTARAHFGVWHRRMGRPDFEALTGVFTPLFHVDIETTDLTLDPMLPLEVRGETFLAKTLDATGAVDRLVREGQHTIYAAQNGARHVVARVGLINVFTRYDRDPARRRVTELPADLALGSAPSRVTELPTLKAFIPPDHAPDCSEADTRVWHYGQTDPNRHVNGIEYLRMMECFASEVLQRAGHDLRYLYFSRARILYRKPCFRGEGYRRVAWIRGAAPLTVTGAFYKAGDAPDARPAVAVELTTARHAGALLDSGFDE